MMMVASGKCEQVCLNSRGFDENKQEDEDFNNKKDVAGTEVT